MVVSGRSMFINSSNNVNGNSSLISVSKAACSSDFRLSSTISLVGSPGTARSGWLMEGEARKSPVLWGPLMDSVSISTSAGEIVAMFKNRSWQ